MRLHEILIVLIVLIAGCLCGCQTENITVSIVVSEAAAKTAMASGTKGKQAYTKETKQDGALNIAIYFGSAKQGAKQEDVGNPKVDVTPL